jgi:hypothetical protein
VFTDVGERDGWGGREAVRGVHKRWLQWAIRLSMRQWAPVAVGATA